MKCKAVRFRSMYSNKKAATPLEIAAFLFVKFTSVDWSDVGASDYVIVPVVHNERRFVC